MARAAAAQISGLVTPGERLRLETSDLGRFEAVAMTAGETVLRVDRNGERLEIATADIRRIWVRRRATGTGAIIGGAVGLAAGITYGLLITRPESSPCDADNCTRAGVTAASGAIGAAIGAGAGALIGTLIPRWRLRFP
jgi:hypothetical protein